MDATIVTPSVDICEIVYESVENSIPDDNSDFYAVIEQIKPLISKQLLLDLEFASSMRLSSVQEAAFRFGWELRGNV